MVFRRQVEELTDPSFDAWEQWQAAEDRGRQLQAENASLSTQLRKQTADHRKVIADLEFQYKVRIGTLESKLKTERSEAHKALKKAARQ